MTGVDRRIAELSPQQRRLLELRLRRRNLAPLAVPRLVPRAGPAPHPLAANQEWLWELDREAGGNPSWNVYTGLCFSGPLDLAALARSLDAVVRRHEVLRSAFPEIGGRPVQVPLPDAALPLPVPLADLSALPAERREPEARRLFTGRWRQVFDLARGPVVRFTLARLAEHEHQLLVMVHHLATDWVSFAVFEREVALAYRAFAAGRPSPLASLDLQFADFARWEGEWLRGEAARAHGEHWARLLAGAPDLALPTDRPRPARQTYRGSRPPLMVPEETCRALKALARGEETTLLPVLLAALNAWLHGLSGQEDLVLGTPVAGRNQRESEGMVGLLLNYLPLRSDLSGDPTFRELLRRARATVLEAYAHQDYPFGRMLSGLPRRRDLSRHPVFQAVLFFLENPRSAEFTGDVGARLLVAYGGTARFDLLVSIWDQGPVLEGWVEHNTDLHDGATVRGWIDRLTAVLAAVAADPGRRLSELRG